MMQQDLFSDLAPDKPAEPELPASPTQTRDFSRVSIVAGQAFEKHLRTQTAAFDITPATVTYADELARLQPGLTTLQRRALTVLILASIIEQRRGSTRLAITELLLPKEKASPTNAPINTPDKASSDLQKDGGKKIAEESPTPRNTQKAQEQGPLLQLIAHLVTDQQDQHLQPSEPTTQTPSPDAHTMPGTMKSASLGDFLATMRDLLTPGAAPILVGRPGDYRPLILDDGYLYHQRMLYYERRLTDSVTDRLRRPDKILDSDALERALTELLDDMPTLAGRTRAMKLNDAQQYALLSALHRPLTLISGGPGTGKTSIVVSLLRLFARLGLKPDQIALAAPTGKAAHRLGESIATHLSALAQPESPDVDLHQNLPTPRTLHRLLGYSPGRRAFIYHEHHRLAQRVVIVDEASMIDLFLMEKLLAAVDPDAQLILLGDADQLPPVDAGAVFRDLVPKNTVWREDWVKLLKLKPTRDKTPNTSKRPNILAEHSIRLEVSYRMDPNSPDGGAILRVAQAINRADTAELLNASSTHIVNHPDFHSLQRRGVELVEPAHPDKRSMNLLLEGFVDHWFAQNYASIDALTQIIRAPQSYNGEQFDEAAQHTLAQLFDQLFKAQALTATRVFATGSQKLNARFHTRHQKFIADTRSAPGATHPNAPYTRRASITGKFSPGEPVIMLQNDYQRGLFNGDQGIIIEVLRRDSPHRHPALMAVFMRAGKFVPFSLDAIGGQLEHAFSLTIHKAQGSEFDHVAIILPKEQLPLFTRELLYTGMTRSRHSVLLVGPREQIAAAANNASRRDSGIAQAL